MVSIFYWFLFLSVLIAVPLITCVIQWVKYGREISTTIFLTVLEVGFMTILITIGISWSRPIETTVIDADGKVITIQTERHQMEQAKDKVTFYIDDEVISYCNVKKVSFRYLDKK